MEDTVSAGYSSGRGFLRRFRIDLLVLVVSCCIFLPLVVSPPHLMDDVDAVQAQIARNMLQSGDWVTARLDGIAYLEKSPLIYWIMAVSFKIFGVHDWAARLPLAIINIALCWVTARFAMWAFDRRAGVYSGTILATCIGIFLFTRILIPDAALTLTIVLALWSFLRLLDDSERRRTTWFLVLYISLACGLLLKGLIAAVFPIAIAAIYLVITRETSLRELAKRIRPLSGLALLLLIAAPWHILATIRNPPYFDWTMHSNPGEYHGFFWFYFLNEHLFRFLNLRYPRDYNTVPRLWFWLLHFVWLFPWSVTLVAAFRNSYRPVSRAGKTRLLALIWIGFVLLFFTLSTTQEYYSLPIYPALAMLLGSDLATREKYPWSGRLVLSLILGTSLCAIVFLLAYNAHATVHGDISNALTQNPDMYTLSLGHMSDLTLHSFAYLRLPLVLAGCGLLIGIIATLRARRTVAVVAGLALMMIVFIQAARLALVAFDPYLSSKALAEALNRSEPGLLIEGDAYYAFSSVFFYTNKSALLWNGRSNNLEYGSSAPNAAHVFIDDNTLKSLWSSERRTYLLIYGSDLPRLKDLLASEFKVVASSGGNYLLTNQ
ncbi:glycosyltransferase family 39 protein [Terriglobus sp. TAA 43]|uniref:ArnT family glycosyltransferase n=1 Tax=Terriglobus sp. TAA 43 TaxID=278961 RepID=UPI001E60947F|nr:glycosyltransferase family 39 protein [Terriglobus sp. TAA 43]